MTYVLKTVFFLCLSLPGFSPLAETNKPAKADKPKPLILQWEVSHSRNTDQISLIFRKNKVELITNISQKSKAGFSRLSKPKARPAPARLGRFQADLSSELKTIKKEVEQYYTRLKKTVPVSSLIKDPRFKQAPDPHAPILRINEETVPAGHTHFKALSEIIHKAYEHKWICLECAEYRILKPKKSAKALGESKKKTGKAIQIIREVKTLQPDFEKNKAKQTKAEQVKSAKQVKRQTPQKAEKANQVKRRVFSKKQLNCVSKGQNKIECVDPQFGIFEL